MNKIVPSLFILLLAGCATSTPDYDARFGDAVRQAKAKMIINPNAGANPDQAAGLDGQAAAEAMGRYHDSFKTPPPATNVINIGGGLGANNAGATGK
ncbi:hypothetical protein [Herbaspirillum sp.]|uniref:hypothetical protein n=1 Tax=Herbaspirillum sp. TaxID=1890675 RepID=UPI001B20A281|nr:hypothetical protein [Herbaspirillum sp.]MBO9537639.1 hypothetical protein [Herbaspirillum sp.]